MVYVGSGYQIVLAVASSLWPQPLLRFASRSEQLNFMYLVYVERDILVMLLLRNYEVEVWVGG